MLDRIPPELLEQILRDDCITPVDLAVSCRVCKAVLLVAGAELYRSVELLVDEEAVSSDTESEPESDAGDNPVFLLDTTQGPPLDVLKRPHIGILVQEIRVCWTSSDGEERIDLEAALQSLAPTFVNPRSIRFDYASTELLPSFARMFYSINRSGTSVLRNLS